MGALLAHICVHHEGQKRALAAVELQLQLCATVLMLRTQLDPPQVRQMLSPAYPSLQPHHLSFLKFYICAQRCLCPDILYLYVIVEN